MDTIAAAPPSRFNVARHLLSAHGARPGKIAYIDDSRRISYGELDALVRRCAAGLLRLGLRPEERVLVLLHDSVHFPIAFLGALYAGVVPVPVNTLLTAADYAYMLQHCHAQAVLASPALLDTARQALSLARLDVPLIVSGTPEFDALLEAPPLADAADTGADDFAFWLYSSGSTGRPKGTVHTHANLYWTAELYGKAVLDLRDDDVVFSAAKLFFAYGLGNALSFPLSVGATTVLMAERPTPAAVFRRWTEHGVTVFCGAPTGYAGMLASPDLPARSQVRLRLCSSAGEALPRDIGERFSAHFGCEIVDGLGSTEMLHIFLSNRPGDVHYGSSGRVVPGYRLRLCDEAGRDAAPGEIGDLFVSGPSAAVMYWGNREQSQRTFQGEWTRTGDKYTRDADGLYTYAGRSDDMLKVSGMYVSPFEVEATLMQHGSVLEAAVIGKPDEHGLTRTKAFVVLRPGQQASEAELKAFVKDRLAPYKYPREIEFIAELPKTATGKIQRFRLRERERA
ncbi:benzoate-CoA ligase family protein [Piscinibacter sp. XHJ-5]|uniref:benzoate-CoA ligase family protein n=1 Tax=Piscinibacter sp. XHJ-5 TaxID=3037797 RepID=UPI00245309B0|nr:benzoate-CoA ligase family protein [Piscinibacter sp. XHJ-5]